MTSIPLFCLCCGATWRANDATCWNCNQSADYKPPATLTKRPSDPIPSHVPQVTRQDVIRIVHRDFAPEKAAIILQLLERYGTESWHYEPDRVHLAILKLSDGNADQVQAQVEIAGSDFRDVVLPAESPEFCKIGFVGVNSLNQKQLLELIENDWAQYVSWLNRI